MSSKTLWKPILVPHGNLLINCLLFWIIITSKGDQIYQKEHIWKGDYFSATNMILEICYWWIIAMFVGKQVSEPMVTLPVEREENSNDAMVQWKFGVILHCLKLLKIIFHEGMIGEWIMKEYRTWSIIKDKLICILSSRKCQINQEQLCNHNKITCGCHIYIVNNMWIILWEKKNNIFTLTCVDIFKNIFMIALIIFVF
jgi:hypothetical protein